jgi:hypothetical protein
VLREITYFGCRACRSPVRERNASTFAGGVGRYLINSERATVSVLGGAAFQNTEYEQSTVPECRRSDLYGRKGVQIQQDESRCDRKATKVDPLYRAKGEGGSGRRPYRRGIMEGAVDSPLFRIWGSAF